MNLIDAMSYISKEGIVTLLNWNYNVNSETSHFEMKKVDSVTVKWHPIDLTLEEIESEDWEIVSEEDEEAKFRLKAKLVDEYFRTVDDFDHDKNTVALQLVKNAFFGLGLLD